jgi:hypothetical protein
VAGDDPDRTFDDMARFVSGCPTEGRHDEELKGWSHRRFTITEEFPVADNPFTKSAALVFMQLRFIDQFNDRDFSWTMTDCKSYRHGQLDPFCDEAERREGNLRPGSPVEN